MIFGLGIDAAVKVPSSESGLQKKTKKIKSTEWDAFFFLFATKELEDMLKRSHNTEAKLHGPNDFGDQDSDGSKPKSKWSLVIVIKWTNKWNELSR